ncbi:MAG: hypothetical protein Q4C53_06815 [Clostridia bacterium]|nr:hypothetical protein [Clostridia bacterium]
MQNKQNGGHSAFVKVTDYLYEVTYDSYEDKYEYAREALVNFQPGACSSVQNGMIRGRNYDWVYDEAPCFVIHVPAAEGRHASVGVATPMALSPAVVDSGEEPLPLDILPYMTLDGMNDAGLTINGNIVNRGEKGEFEMKSADPAQHIMPVMIPRLLLDKAATIEEAVALLEPLDVTSLGPDDEGHFMITARASATDDSFKTVVVEFIPGEDRHYRLNVIDKFVGGKPIMTNFHLTDFDGSEESLTPHPMGYERYLVLQKNYGMGTDVPGMIDLMKKVYYTRNYDLYNENFWYSEYAKIANLTMADRGAAYLGGDVSKAGAFAAEIAKEQNDYKHRSRTGGNMTWQTVHMSVYDIEKREVSVLSQEGSIVYKFDLNGRIG